MNQRKKETLVNIQSSAKHGNEGRFKSCEDQAKRTTEGSKRERNKYMGDQMVVLNVDKTFIISMHYGYQSILTYTLQKELPFE